MMPDRIRAFMQEHGLAKEDVWEIVRKGKGTGQYCVKHAALERIAAASRIAFDEPRVLECQSDTRTIALLVTGRLGEASVWSIGEASPANCRIEYPWAMAEKRAKDRCILKLLDIHGVLYSEDEMPDPEPVRMPRSLPPSPPPSTMDMLRASVAATEPKSSYSLKKDAPDLWPTFEREMRQAGELSTEAMQDVWDRYRVEMFHWPRTWQESADEIWAQCEEGLRARMA